MNNQIQINQKNLDFINTIRNPKLKFNLYQTYTLDNHPMGFKEITIEKPDNSEDVPCCSHFLSDKSSKKKIGVIRNNNNFGLFSYLFPTNCILYHVVLQDGIIRNVVNKDLSDYQKLLLAGFESRSIIDLYKNLNHVKTFGCFCIIIPVLENNTLTIKRFNRWNEDIDHVYNFISKKS